MDFVLILSLLFVQLGSLAATYGLIKFKLIEESLQNGVILSYGLALLVVVITYGLFRRGYRYVDPLMYVFSFFSFGALRNLELALELNGCIPKVLLPGAIDFCPFLKTAHGVATVYWDGVVHFTLAAVCLVLYTCKQTHREVALYWAGSVSNGLLVILPAMMTGKGQVNSYLLSSAFLTVIPMLALINLIHNRTIQARTFLKFPPIWKRPVDLLFFIYFAIALNVNCIRALAVNGGNVPVVKDYIKAYEPYLADASGAPKFQALTYDYMYGIYYLFAMYGLWVPGQHWMGDFALVTAGGAAQAQFTYIAGAMHSSTPASLRPAMEGKAAAVFWTVNILLLLVPQLFVWHTQRDVEMFGRTQTVNYACPIRKRVYVVKETKETTTTTKKME